MSIKSMEGYRSKGRSLDWFIDITARDGDTDPKHATRLHKLAFLTEGSPTLRYIIHQLRH